MCCSKVVTDAARDSGVPLGVDALSLAAVAHANRSPYLLRVGMVTRAAFISRQEKRMKNSILRVADLFGFLILESGDRMFRAFPSQFSYILG